MKQRSAFMSAVGFTVMLLALLAISLTAQAAPSANAPAKPQAILLADDFDYGTTAGNLVAVSAGNWISHSGTSGFVGYTTTSLSMAGYGSSGVGGAATVSTSGVEDVNRSFTNQTSGTVYFAALVNVSSAGAGTYFMHLKDATTGFRARVFARNDTGVLRFGLDTTGSGTYATNAYSYTTTYLLVTKYNLDTGATALYVLDAFSSSEPATPVVSFTTGTTVTVQAIALRQASGGPSAIIDGVRVGNTWAEVVGSAPPAQSDLHVAKSGPATANAGDPITYTISLSNTGTATATLSVLTDTLPAQVAYVTYTTAAPVTFTHPSATQLVWELGDVLTTTPAISIQVVGVITTNIANGTVVTNTATASTASVESNTANNTSHVATTVSSTVLPDVEVYAQKTTPNAIAFGNELITYTIVYGNDGTQAVEAVLTDTLPISFTTADIAFDTSGLTPIDGAGARAWTRTLASGDRFTFTLALTVPTSIVNGTHITNTIVITAAGSGNNPGNDLSSASSTVYQLVPISTARAGSNGQVFGVEGRVIYVPGTYNTNEWGLQDSSGGIAVFYSPPPVVALGDRVRLVATRGAFSGQAQLAAPVSYFAHLGPGPQVNPLPFTTGQVAAGASEGWLSVITGTVSGLGACSGDYQFNLDDGTGPAVVFVDATTTVNVCALGAVNGGPLVVSGFSTQFNGTFEVKPRFSADVKLLYQVNFVYHDVEDVIHAGEDVQLRGDFTNWNADPITMTHDVGRTVFTATVTFTSTGVQNYRYYAPAGGASGYEWLNSSDRFVQVLGSLMQKDDYRTVFPDAAALQGPASITINLGQTTPDISATVLITGVTDFDSTAGRSLRGQIGYGTSSDPALWTWSPAAFTAKSSGSDVFAGVFTPTANGVYSYAARFNANWGTGNPGAGDWTYADLNGLPFSPGQAGVLTVTAPHLSIAKTVATSANPMNLGGVVTYTFTLSNTGSGTATSILITDVLPTGVNFGGFVQQNSAVYGSGAVTWSGSLTADASATVIFTATVKNDQTLYGADILNTVQFTSGNGGSGSANTAFAIVNRYFLYLPLIQR